MEPGIGKPRGLPILFFMYYFPAVWYTCREEEGTGVGKYKAVYYITVALSALVGLWHFFVPRMFQWYDYLPMRYENLVVGIDYTNYCFSLLLFGLSLLLAVLGGKALAMNREVIVFYWFLTVVWVFRAALATFVEPWPLEPIPAAAIGQLAASDGLAVLMCFVSVNFLLRLRKP